MIRALMRLAAAVPLAVYVAVSAASVPAAAGDGSGGIIRTLEEAAAGLPRCDPGAIAAAATAARLRRLALPDTGRLIVINIPGSMLTAYSGGLPVLGMRVVVGRPDRRTPEMRTEVVSVRLNPSWTVPAGILAEPEWQDRLADAGFLAENGFQAYGADGRRLPDSGSGTIARLVQAPGPANPLGVMKIALRASDGIYLHGTNEPEAFDGDDPALSHGCVRVEDPYALAGWVLGRDAESTRRIREAGDVSERRPGDRIPVVFGYFTAWPDAAGRVQYYPDIYGRDTPPASCRDERVEGSE